MSFIREHVVKRLTRSPGWRKVRNRQIELFPACCVCNKKKGLEAHHVKPFKDSPELELDPTNLCTMCRRCHFVFGHLFYWSAINLNLTKTVIYMKRLILGRV